MHWGGLRQYKFMRKIYFKRYLKDKKFLSLILVHILIIALACILILIRFPCPFKFIFGIPCPACGTMHALLAIIKLDFDEYVKQNYLAIFLILAFWLGMHKKTLFKNSRFIDYFIYVVCFLDIIRYFSKIFVDFL